MSFIAAAGGFLLGPVLGEVAGAIVGTIYKPKDVSNQFLLSSLVHAGMAAVAYEASDHFRDPALRSFANGAVWGEGIAAGLRAAGGVYLKTDAGKKALSEGRALPTDILALGPKVSGEETGPLSYAELRGLAEYV